MKIRAFTRHYVEMLLAMFAGMLVIGGPLSAAGVEVEAVELQLLNMALIMSVPMVAWMRYRGHGWAPAGEMTASMFVPSLAAIALLWLGLVGDHDALMAIQHAAMFPAMAVAMLLRLDEYTGTHAHA
jgi:hypothetical protein